MENRMETITMELNKTTEVGPEISFLGITLGSKPRGWRGQAQHLRQGRHITPAEPADFDISIKVNHIFYCTRTVDVKIQVGYMT